MRAHYLYSAIENLEFCSGEDLQEFFEKECGTPSPHGDTEVNSNVVREFVKEIVYNIRVNSPSAANKIYWDRVQCHATVYLGIEDAFRQGVL